MEHIENTILGMNVIPDFGFEASIIDKGSNLKGWGLFRDYVQANYKYERLENYIYAR